MNRSTLIAYHGKEPEKQAILAQLAAHRAADQIVQNNGYWKEGRGCAVGCTLHSSNHMEYETRFGIPAVLARLEDSIFEGLPVALACQWPERFMSAIQPGADLSLVQWQFLRWLLTTESVNPGIEHPIVAGAVSRVAELMARLIVGESAASVAASAASAASAAWSAASVAASAESAASVAASAESAAWSAASVAASAESAAWSARRAAERAASAAISAASSASSAASSARAASAAWTSMSDTLIRLLEARQ